MNCVRASGSSVTSKTGKTFSRSRGATASPRRPAPLAKFDAPADPSASAGGVAASWLSCSTTAGERPAATSG